MAQGSSATGVGHKLLKSCHTLTHTHGIHTEAKERGANKSSVSACQLLRQLQHDDSDSELRLRKSTMSATTTATTTTEIDRLSVWAVLSAAQSVSLGQIGVRDTSKARITYACTHTNTHTHTHTHTHNVARVLLFESVCCSCRRRLRRRGSQMRNEHVRVRSL